MRNLLPLVSLIIFTSGCGLPGTAGERLSRDECRAILTHVDQSSARKLGVAFTGVNEGDVDRCVAEQSWSRATYECVMKARTKLAIDTCILES